MAGVKRELITGAIFTAIAKYANLIISLVVTGVLARLLAPEQFGIITIASLAITFLNILADIGFSPTVIQHKDLDKQALNILFSLSVYIAFTLSLLFFFAADFFANWYEQPLLKPICHLLTINLFFSAISVVPNALFYRERMFKFIAVRSFIVQLIGGILSLLLAWKGAGVYALAVNPVFSAVAIFGISYTRFPLTFKFRISLNKVKHVFAYSLFQFLFNIINYFSRNVDSLLIGKYLGMVPLGYYDKSYRLMSLPLQNITQVVTPVVHPILSQKGHDRGYLRQANEKLVGFFAIVGFPLSIFLFFSADELIMLFFGPQWKAAVPAFEILSLSVGIQLIMSSSGSIFQTAGDTKSLFVCGLFSAILNVSGILLGVFYFGRIEAVAQCLLITFMINFIQTYWQMYTVVFEHSPQEFFKALVKPILFAIILGIFMYIIVIYVKHLDLIYSLILKCSIFGSFYGMLLWFGGYKNDILSLLKKKKPLA